MKGHKQYAIKAKLTTAVVKQMKWYRWKVTITGRLASTDSVSVKKRIFEVIKPAAERLPGAEELQVNTLRASSGRKKA